MDNGISRNLIVTDGVKEVTRFKEIIEDDSIKKIVINISGGTDSPLVVYFMAKFIQQTESFEKEIYPHFMVDTGNLLTIAPSLVPKQLDVIRELFPDVIIHDVLLQNFLRTEDWNDDLERYVACNKGEDGVFNSDNYELHKGVPLDGVKNLHCTPLKEKMEEMIKPDAVLSGITANLPFRIMQLYGLNPKSQPQGRKVGANKTWSQEKLDRSPWNDVDKRFIAHQYRKENLMENLFPLTESCLVESVGELIENGCEPDAYPCKICHQCVEKFVAFGMYDKCWTK